MTAPKKVSVKGAARKALAADKKMRTPSKHDVKDASLNTIDSFQNFAAKLGMGTGNLNDFSSYGFNPVSRVRTLMEWMHRGSWVAGVAVDTIAEDMTREGVSLEGEIDPGDIEHLQCIAKQLNIWQAIRDTVAWARLYGGCIAVLLIDGQKPETPLNLKTIGPKQFKGLLVLDRWMVDPSLNNLVTELGPSLGLPKFYMVTADAPALPRMKIHHSRCIRLEGIRLPYWQKLQENLWGISVLERVFDRMVAFDSATQGAAQLVHKAYIRTYKVKELREILAKGGADGTAGIAALTAYADFMRLTQSTEGMTLMDAEDEFEGVVSNPFSGLNEVLVQFGQQLSGALQVPLVRLFGQSPSGFNTDDADLKNYYDGINNKQESELSTGVNLVYRVMGASEGIDLPDDFTVAFNPLWQLSDKEKSEIASTDAQTVNTVESSGTIDRGTALKELKQLSRISGRFTNITREMIDDAEGEMAPAATEVLAKAGEEEVKSAPNEAEKETKPVAPESKNIKDAIERLSRATTQDSLTRAAGTLLFHEGKILLLRRSASQTNPGAWDIPGGHLDGHETAAQAARRELEEETGFSSGNAMPELRRSNENGVEYTTHSMTTSSEFRPFLSDEHDDYCWVTPAEALGLPLVSGLYDTIRRLG